jgi:hypothetical protein
MLDLGDWRTIERRIGVRVPVEGIEVRWLPSPDVIDLRSEAWLARVVEVSVTGAVVEASSSLPVELAGPATLRYGSVDSAVTVRHASPTDTEGVTRYGVEWKRLEDPLQRVVYGAVADNRTPA